MTRPSTRALIEGAHRHSAFYRGGFANHLPMALVALDAMGASDARIEAFTRNYERQLEPISDFERGRVDGFAQRIARRGGAAVLREDSRRLADGISTAAFHGAIRTAYAFESGSDLELAHALAYWDAEYTPLACDAAPRGNETPVEVLTAVSRDPAYSGKRPAGNGISARMHAAVGTPAFAEHVERLDPAALRFDQLAHALISAYAATNDFTLLHGVTGCHAFGLLAPHFEDGDAALHRLWISALAAYMSCGSPALDHSFVAEDDTRSWEDVHARACARDDEHDVKLAYSCWREWQRSGDDLYRRAASARLRPSPPPSPKGEGALS